MGLNSSDLTGKLERRRTGFLWVSRDHAFLRCKLLLAELLRRLLKW